jgi:hypothetical protein
MHFWNSSPRYTVRKNRQLLGIVCCESNALRNAKNISYIADSENLIKILGEKR